MKNHTLPGRSNMVSQLFFYLLPVQVAIVAMGSINSIVDGFVAGRFIGVDSVAVIGLFYTMLRVLEALSGILLGGVTVLSGRFLGAGKMDETRGICSLGLTCALIIGAVLSFFCLFFPDNVSTLLGADENLLSALSTYTRGFAIGIIPAMLTPLLSATLLLERQGNLANIGVTVMIITNVSLDFLFVVPLKLGLWGLAMATALGNWAYFLIMATYYLRGKAELKLSPRYASWRKLWELLRIGFPNALLVICLAARSLVVNIIVLICGGLEGLTSLSAFNMLSGLVVAFALGAGAVIRMLSSVFLGEENREDLGALMKTVFTKAMAMVAAIGILVVVCSPLLSRIFFEPDMIEFDLTKLLFVIYGFCTPLVLACVAMSNYCQAIGHQRFVLLTALADGFFSFVIPALLLARFFGVLGVWLSFPIGLLLTWLLCVFHVRFHLKHWPRSMGEWLMLPEEFGSAEHLVLSISNMEEVVQTSEKVQSFCEAHGMSLKTAVYSGLCLEELARNIVQHGFAIDKKPHMVEVRVAFLPDGVLLRVKDNCKPFNPKEWYDFTSPNTTGEGVGIRLVYGLAKHIEYKNMLGLNVLSVIID